MIKRLTQSVMFIVCLIAYGVSHANPGLGEYSNGYRLGVINKFSEKGVISKSFEGEMLLGKDSTPYSKIVDVKSGKKAYYNPWRFSAPKSMAGSINAIVGSQPVVVHYTQAVFANALAQDTDYSVDKVYAINKTFTDTCKTTAKGAKSEGVRVGRIVKASVKGNINKTYELMMQIGDSGGQFVNMSTNEDSIYQCAVRALMSGKAVKVGYKQGFFELFNDTSYAVIDISPNEVKGW